MAHYERQLYATCGCMWKVSTCQRGLFVSWPSAHVAAHLSVFHSTQSHYRPCTIPLAGEHGQVLGLRECDLAQRTAGECVSALRSSASSGGACGSKPARVRRRARSARLETAAALRPSAAVTLARPHACIFRLLGTLPSSVTKQVSRHQAEQAAATFRPHAFAALSSQRDSSLTLPALHKGTDDTWQAASRCARDVQHLPFVLASKLQLALSEGIEHTLYEQCFASCGAHQQAILRSLSEHSDCSAWLTVLPTEPAYRMQDEQFRLAVRHRLGMLPYDDLREEYCLACRRRDSSIPLFLTDPDHLHACTKLQCGNADIAARGTQSLRIRQAASSSLHASHIARHEPAGRRHRKHSLQPSGEYDDDALQAGAAFHAQMLAAQHQLCTLRLRPLLRVRKLSAFLFAWHSHLVPRG